MRLARWSCDDDQWLALEVGGEWHNALEIARRIPDLRTTYGTFSDWVAALSWTSRAAVEVLPWLEQAVAQGIHRATKPLEITDRHRLRAPFWGEGTIYCAAVNYRSHAREAHVPVPEQPLFFIKPFRCVIDPAAPIVLPSVSGQVDYEGEFACVIGSPAHYTSAADALDHVVGLTLINDVSFRDLHVRDTQNGRVLDWVRGKALDGAAPIGPWILFGADLVPKLMDAQLKVRVNGHLRQDCSNSDQVFRATDLVKTLSQGLTLQCGDVVATGTCSGIGKYGSGFLRPGDEIEVEAAGLGILRNGVIDGTTEPVAAHRPIRFTAR